MTHAASGHGIGDWCWHERHAAPCRVVDRQDVWGEIAYRVWLPAKDAVVRARAKDDVRRRVLRGGGGLPDQQRHHLLLEDGHADCGGGGAVGAATDGRDGDGEGVRAGRELARRQPARHERRAHGSRRRNGGAGAAAAATSGGGEKVRVR